MTTRIVIRPEFVSSVRVITHDLTTASRAENGCILYHFAESLEKEGIFSRIMIWWGEASHQRQAASDYARAFTRILSAGMPEKPPVFEKWRSPE